MPDPCRADAWSSCGDQGGVTEETIPSLAKSYREDFLVGAAVSRSEVMGAAGDLVSRQFSALVADNEMKPSRLAPREGEYAFAEADEVVTWARERGIAVRGHCLIWHRQTPSWMFSHAGKPVSREIAIERMRRYVHDVVGHFKGRVWAWDVVNEAVALGRRADRENGWRKNGWYRAIGPDYIRLAFQFAHEADPGALLLYNDYETQNPAKLGKILELLRSLQRSGIAVDGLGTQAHAYLEHPNVAELELTIVEVAKLGLRNHVTELDVSLRERWGTPIPEPMPATLARQARRYGELFGMFLRHRDEIDSVQLWGVTDELSWLRPDRPLLFSRYRPKPAFFAVLQEARRTRAEDSRPPIRLLALHREMRIRRLTCSCIVNNHNYGRFVREAVESALAQTRPFNEVIVVDDGSTDGSQNLLRSWFGDTDRVRLICKPNGGQLSAFHAGLAHGTGDVVFFLDADDRYLPTRVAETMAVFESQPAVDAVFTPLVLFGERRGLYFSRTRDEGVVRPAQDGTAADAPEADFALDLESTSLAGDSRQWIGSPTSGIAALRTSLERFLPLPAHVEEAWRLGADNCLVYGLSLARAHRVYLHRPLVEYRVHGANAFYGSEPDGGYSRCERSVAKLTLALRRRMGLPRSSLESIARRAIRLWRVQRPNRVAAFGDAWLHGWRAGLPWREVWRVRGRLLGALLGASSSPARD